MIIGVGLDLIEIDRIARALERRPRFAERCFTEGEIAYCSAKPFPAQHYAARFAAKEAVGKALGRGMTRWREVEVVRGRGAPTVRLHDHYREWAERLGVTGIVLTLTHSKGMAAASAIAEGPGEPAGLDVGV